MKYAFNLACLVLLAPSPSVADEVSTLAKGAPERKAILDVIRPFVEQQLGAPIEFVVNDLKISGGFGFAQLSPQRPGGEGIDPKATPYAAEAGTEALDFWDCCHTEAVLEQISGKWTVQEIVVGSTDVWYTNWCAQTPKGLIAICEALPPN